MAKKEKTFRKRINTRLMKPCSSSISHGCKNIAMWEISSKNGVSYACGNSACIKRAEKYVK